MGRLSGALKSPCYCDPITGSTEAADQTLIRKRYGRHVIAIAWHKSELYEWTILYGSELVDGEAGDSSISACLTSAVAVIPDDVKLLEVRYRAMRMGTFTRVALEETPEIIAEQIANCYRTQVE